MLLRKAVESPSLKVFSRATKKSITFSGQGMLVPALRWVMDLESSSQAYHSINVNVIINIQSRTQDMCSFHIFILYLTKMENTADKLYSGCELRLVFIAKVSIN